jgi:hypothetical protein
VLARELQVDFLLLVQRRSLTSGVLVYNHSYKHAYLPTR